MSGWELAETSDQISVYVRDRREGDAASGAEAMHELGQEALLF